MKEDLIVEINRQIKSAEKELKEFIPKFKKDPAYAFSWSHGYFSLAGKLKILKMALRLIKKKHTDPKDVLKYMRDQVLSSARWTENSTSPVSNAMAACEKNAMADFVHTFSFQIERE